MLLIEIEIGICHAEIPPVIIPELLFVLFEKGYGVFQHVAIICGGLIVVCTGQFAVHFWRTFVFRDGFQCINDFSELILLVPDLALLHEVHICFLLRFWWRLIGDRMKHTLIVTTESRSVRGFQQGNDVGIVVADGIECIKAGVVWIIHIRLTFITGGEAPATIPVVVRFFSVAIANLAALNHDSVCCQASVCAGPVRKKRFHLFFRDIEVFVSAA